MLQKIRDFLWPTPPGKISKASQDALRADVKSAGIWGKELDDVNRQSVDVWVRHGDNLGRAANRAWLAPRAKVYAVRWGTLALLALGSAFASSGLPVLEVPMTLAAVAAGGIAAGFLIAHRVLNR